MLKIIVLGCVLAAVGITLKIRLDTPQGPQPLARAIVTNHLQAVKRDLALPQPSDLSAISRPVSWYKGA